MNETTRLLKNTILITIGNFSAKAISFLLLPLYTSILTTEEYGTYDLIVAISTFLIPLVTISMHEAMFRFIIDVGKNEEELKKILSNSFLLVIFGILLLAIILMCIHFIIPQEDMLIYIWFYVTTSSLYLFSNNMLRGLGRIKEYATISSCKNIVQLILNVIVVAVFRLGMKGLFLSLCVSEILAFWVVFFISKMWKYINFKHLSFKKIKPMLRYATPLIPNAVCAHIIHFSDRIVISAFLGNSANGIYSVSYKFSNMVETVYHYFYTAWSESASRILAKGKEKATEYYKTLYNMIDNFMFSVILLMIAGMPILFRIFVKGDYVEGFKYVTILLLAVYLDCLAKFYSGIFTALKKTRIMATSTIVAALINVVVNVVLIEKIGLFAAASSTLLAEIVLVLMRKRSVSKDIKIEVNYKRITVKIALILIMQFLYDYNNRLKTSIAIIIAIIYALYANKDIIRSFGKKVIAKVYAKKREK